MDEDKRRLITAISIIVGACIGAGFLGIPYVAAQAGFFIVLGYLLFFGAVIILVNLYFGEVILRTRGEHQLVGFAARYLGKKGKMVMFLFTNIAIFSALLAYMIGVGESFSFLIFGNAEYGTELGALFGFSMSVFLWRGMKSIKTLGKLGVAAIFLLFAMTIFTSYRNIELANLLYFNLQYTFLPFGVILFSLIEFYSLPEARIILRHKEKLMKKAIIIGTITPIIFYILFTLFVVGTHGENTPEIATLALGNIFVFIGIFSMFTSYLVVGNSLQQSYLHDMNNSKIKAWGKSAILPIIVFLFFQIFDFFSFISALFIGGVVAGGLIVILVLIITKKTETKGNRASEYKIKISNTIIFIIALIFLSGIIFEALKFFGFVKF
ncbi:MAG: aromatic amino acid transport family protein [archaeon]